jgi:hypothetical protein
MKQNRSNSFEKVSLNEKKKENNKHMFAEGIVPQADLFFSSETIYSNGMFDVIGEEEKSNICNGIVPIVSKKFRL